MLEVCTGIDELAKPAADDPAVSRAEALPHDVVLGFAQLIDLRGIALGLAQFPPVEANSPLTRQYRRQLGWPVQLLTELSGASERFARLLRGLPLFSQQRVPKGGLDVDLLLLARGAAR